LATCRIADWQSAECRIFEPAADCQSAVQQTASLRYRKVPDSLPNIVGQIPLKDLDWVVDCRNQKLIPNPEHKHGELSDEF
jgi:hypothetical protein